MVTTYRLSITQISLGDDNLVPRSYVTLVQRNRSGRLWNNSKLWFRLTCACVRGDGKKSTKISGVHLAMKTLTFHSRDSTHDYKHIS